MLCLHLWIIVMTGCAVLDTSLGLDGRRIVSDLVFLTALLVVAHLLWTLWFWWQDRLSLDWLPRLDWFHRE